MQQTNPQWLISQAQGSLKGQINIAVSRGYHVISQTNTTAQLFRKKSFSCLFATLSCFLFGIGFLIYLFYYLAKKDDTIYLDIETQPDKEEMEKLVALEKARPWYKKRPIAVGILGFFVFVTIIGSFASSDKPSQLNSNVGASTTSTQKVVFDVPSLIGKNVDQIKKVLGKPVDKLVEPTKVQLEAMGQDATWDNSFEKNGVTLLITYNPRTRQVIDFFISDLGDQDKARIMAAGNLKAGDSAYILAFVKALKDPTTYTGLKITPRAK